MAAGGLGPHRRRRHIAFVPNKSYSGPFSFLYASGTAWIQSEVTHLQSNAAAVGIKLNREPKPFNDLGAVAGNCVVAKLPCNWDMVSFGNGWSTRPISCPPVTRYSCAAQLITSGGTPNAAYQLTEIASNLKGALPQSPTLSINPETGTSSNSFSKGSGQVVQCPGSGQRSLGGQHPWRPVLAYHGIDVGDGPRE
jgi:hypothetical protein